VKNSPINNRYAFFGIEQKPLKHGRGKEGEEIRYVDVISMYPDICKYGKFLIGHPKMYVIAGCTPDCLDREGIIKCKVVSPRKLYHQ
jgi:hypothetical protein